MGEFVVLGELLGLACLGGSQTDFGAIIGSCGNASGSQGVNGKLKSLGGFVIVAAAKEPLAVGNGLIRADNELLAD